MMMNDIHHSLFGCHVACTFWCPTDSCRNASILLESAGFQWNGTGIQQNEPGFHWIVTEGTCLSACKYKCVYINRLCSLSVSLSLSRYTLPFLGQISHDTIIVALSLPFLMYWNHPTWCCFHRGKCKKVEKSHFWETFFTSYLHYMSTLKHNSNIFRKLQCRATTFVFGYF